MAQYIYNMHRVSKKTPTGKEILKDISLSFLPGAKIGVLGLNGAGKSTLLKIMAGIDTQYDGEAHALSGIKVGFLPQEPVLDPQKSVKAVVLEAFETILKKLQRFNEISMAFAEPMSEDEMTALLTEQGKLQQAIDDADAWDLERTLEMAADALRLPPWETSVQVLSGGEKRRVALCRLLLSQPDMLLLDEPTNHLDAESIAWLEHFLAIYKGTVVAVTHDRYFLDNVAGWILELDRGHGLPYEGNYTNWLAQKEKRLAIEEKQAAARLKAIEHEREWAKLSPKGRHAKNKARLNRFEELCSKSFQERNETNEIYIPPGPHLGDKVIQVNQLAKTIEDRLLFENLSFELPKGAILGIIGPNGSGKSTLFKLLMDLDKPTKGEIHLGETVKLAYIDQSRDALAGDKTVWEEVSGGQDILVVGSYEMPSRAYLGRFNFKGGDQQKLVKDLSGGERNRLHLAKLLKSGGNVLLLDEPTNDLDVETLRALEEGILAFPGSAIVISHDRWFLDRIATHILAFEGDSHVEFFPGNYTEYELDRKKRLGEVANQPRRIKFKRQVFV